MEKIQQALARARQARDGASPVPAPTVRGVAAAQAAPLAVETAWETLPEAAPLPPGRDRRGNVFALAAAGSTTAFEVMRTRTLQMMQQAGWRRLGITSPSAACGKTTIVANLGQSLARQSDLRVMLVDFDLRRPALGPVLGIEPVESLEPMLAGEVRPEAVLRRVGPRLAVACGRRPVPGASDLLRSPRTGELIRTLESTYEPTLTIFDLPPMMIGDDVMSFAPHLDAVLILAKAGVTTVKDIDRCERDLAAQTNVLGVVLNQCEFASDDEYGYKPDAQYSYG